MDLKKDPKFLEEVRRRESKQFAKVLLDPISIRFDDITWFIIAVGINDTYLVAHIDDYWCDLRIYNLIKDRCNPALIDEVRRSVLEWIMVSDETSYKKVPHRDMTPNACIKFTLAILAKSSKKEKLLSFTSPVNVIFDGLTMSHHLTGDYK